MVIIDFSGAKEETASHGKQPRFPVKGTGAVFASLHGACQERGDLCSRAGGVGVETTAANTGGNAVLDGPSHGHAGFPNRVKRSEGSDTTPASHVQKVLRTE